MPTYQYRCKDCDTDLEVVQKFTDEALTDCPVCEDGTLRKVFNAVGVVFKGSGFYRTDSRATSSSPDSATESTTPAGAAATSAGDSKTSSEGTKTAAPAAVGSAG